MTDFEAPSFPSLGEVRVQLERVAHDYARRAPMERFVGIVDVSNILFHQLSPANLLRFARCNKAIYHQVLSYIDYAFNIESRLSQYFSSPTSFRTLQARTGTLISGSTALQFFDRTRYADSDLDLYTPIEHHLEVGDWLTHAGYEFRPNERQLPTFKEAALNIIGRKTATVDGYGWRGVSGVFDFFFCPPRGVQKKVQIIACTRCPMEVILGFHSTCVMNIIAFDRAYSLYPKTTFEERRSLICATPGPSKEPALSKYRIRGWEIIKCPPISEQYDSRSPFRLGYRWIDDDLTWMIPLDTTGLLIPTDHPSDPASLTNWRLSSSGNYMSTIYAKVAQSVYLKHAYIVTDPRVQELTEVLLDQRDLEDVFIDQEYREDTRKAATTLVLQRAMEMSSVPRSDRVPSGKPYSFLRSYVKSQPIRVYA